MIDAKKDRTKEMTVYRPMGEPVPLRRRPQFFRVRGTLLLYCRSRNLLVTPRSVPMPKIEPVRSLWGNP